MNGQMMNYKRYYESLNNTPEPQNVPKLQIDYKALVKYAKEKNVLPGDLSNEEKAMFIVRKAAAI